MCVAAVAPLLSMVVGVAQAVVSYNAQMDDYNNKLAQWRQNVVNAQAAAADEQKQLLIRHMQEERAANEKIKVSQLEEAEKKALAEVSAGAGNVSGLSVQNLIADIGRQSAFNRQNERTNFLYKAQQLQQEQKATITRAQQRIASVPYPTKPSAAAAAVSAASAVVGGLRAFSG